MGLEFDFSDVLNGVDRMERDLDSALVALTGYWATQAENQMKTNASWTDQTGNARNGLTGRAGKEGSTYIIDMFHTVPYGIWLEVRWGGLYSTVLPTMEQIGPKVMNHVRGLLGRM